MGEYAEYTLANAMRRGLPDNTKGKQKSLEPTIPCPVCGKLIRTHDGLTQHIKDKHKDQADGE